MTPQRLLNDICKPYDELNALLAQRFAFEPELSDITRLAGSIAVSLRHIPEAVGFTTNMISNESVANRLIIDVADSWKHGSLRDPSRSSKLFVSAMFEWQSERGFRFIRNGLAIIHSTLGEHDFLKTALEATHFWIKKLQFNIVWKESGKILEAPEEFHPTAFLFYDSKYCISMKNTRFRFFSRNAEEEMIAIDPAEVRMEIYEKDTAEPKAGFTLRKKELIEKRQAGIKTWKSGAETSKVQ